MRILIVEDEPPIARDIAFHCRQILGNEILSIKMLRTLEESQDYLAGHSIDLLLLDLNLHGRNGYELLKRAVAGSFHTIIISAYTEQAIEAYEYGVLDFIPKPFDQKRLQTAFDRYFGRLRDQGNPMRHLAVRKDNRYVLIAIDNILYFKAANFYVEACLKTGHQELLDKTMDRLEQILPDRFYRIHRSYIVDTNQIRSFTPVIQGSSQLMLENGTRLPMSRSRYKGLLSRLNS